IPPHRTRYLSEISESNRRYDTWTREQREIAQRLYALRKTIDACQKESFEGREAVVSALTTQYEKLSAGLDPANKKILDGWDAQVQAYKEPVFTFKVRD